MAGIGSRLLILCYHAVSDAWPSEGAVAPRALERQLRRLLRRGFRPLTLADALHSPPDRRALVVTFDDAYLSVWERGREVLERLGVPGTLFVPTDSVSSGEPMSWGELGRWVGTEHERELLPMSWEQVRDLDAGGWEIGSHTSTHPRLTELGAAAAARELGDSRAACERRLQKPCASLAYPFGAYDDEVVRLAAEAGYERAVTLPERLLAPIGRERPLELSRDGVYRSTGTAAFLLMTASIPRRLRAARV